MRRKKRIKKSEGEHILLAYAFDGEGVATPLDNKQAVAELKSKHLAWVHLDVDHEKTSSWLKKEVSYLDDIVIDALLAEETRPRVMEFDQGSLIILRGVNLNENAEPEDMVSIRLWIDDSRIISIQRRNVKAIYTIEEMIKSKKVTIRNAGEFVSILCHELSENLESFLEDLGEFTDKIEDKILDCHDSDLREDVIKIRRQAITLKRHLNPDRDAIAQLATSNQSWVSELDKRRFNESYNHLTRYIEDLDEIRERSQVVHDELTNAITERVNRNMYLLSVIASVFLPLTFFTGLFGMNVGGIPGYSENYAFFVISFLMICMGVIQIVLFKTKKWF